MGAGCFTNIKEKINLIWIDQKIDNKENNNYVNILKSNKSLKIQLFKNVDDAINYLKIIRFEETKVIVSGLLYSKLVEKLK